MSNCNECQYKRKNDKQPEPVPGHVFEVTTAAFQLTIKRLIAVIIILVSLLVASNIAWVIYESQFEDITVEQDAENGINNLIGGNGDIYNGETDNQNPSP